MFPPCAVTVSGIYRLMVPGLFIGPGIQPVVLNVHNETTHPTKPLTFAAQRVVFMGEDVDGTMQCAVFTVHSKLCY